MDARIPRPDLIFFDVGNTLVRAHPSWSDVYLSACRAFGLDIEAPALERALAVALKAGFWDEHGPFDASEDASYSQIKRFDETVMAELGQHELPDAFYRHLWDAFARASAWHVFPDVLPCLEALAEAALRRAVISNWVWGAPELLHDLDLARHFDTLVISARVGYNKPHRGIFDHALELTGVAPERAIHVGDSYSADVAGARSAGITPVLIDRRHVDEWPELPIPDGDDVPVIRDLWGLLELIDLPVRASSEPSSG
ncbi:HAD-IA family hydrolase [soil metagenome]